MPNKQSFSLNKQSFSSNRGFSLIEVMVALMILSVVSGAVVLMTLQVLSVTNSSRLKNQATSFAQEILERVRSEQLANGWTAVSIRGLYNNQPTTKCYSDLWTGIDCPSDCAGVQISGTKFYRYVSIRTETSGLAYITAKAVVTWQDKGSCRKAEVDTNLYNY